MNEFFKLLLPWREATDDQISDIFVYGILLFFIILLVIFLWKIIRRGLLIARLTKEVRKYNGPAQPPIKQELENKFARKGELTEAWQEFENSLITRQRDENQGVIYKTDEASLFFSEDRLLGQYMNLRYWNSIPALLVGLGILGTFVGLVWGLIPFSSIDFTKTEEIQEAIRELLSGVSTAFVTSVWGMLASLLFNGLEKWGIGRVSRAIANLQRALDRLFTLTTQEEISFRQEDELAQQTQALKSFSTDLANDIKSAMTEGRQQILTELHNAPEAFSNAIVEQLAPSLDKLNEAIEELREQKEESSADAIGQLIEQFQDSLSTSTVTQMEELAKTVGDASQSLMNLPNQMEQMIGGVREQIDQSRQLLAESSEAQTAQMRSMMDGMLNAFQGTIDTQQAGLSETTDSVNEQMKQVASDIRDLLESAANRADEQLGQRMADMEAISDQSIQTLQTAIAQLQQSITSTASQTTTESEAMTNRMRELLESAANRVDEQLGQRMADMETISDQSIQTLQTTIAELGQSITSTLNQQQQTISEITSQTAKASAEATDQMHQLVDRTAIRLGESVQGAEKSINTLLQQQGDQIEAFNEQITNSQATLTKSREMLEQMNTSVTSVRQLIEKTEALSGQLMKGTAQLESAGQYLTKASEAFNRENEKYLATNRETTEQIQVAVGHLNDSVQRFQTIDNGLQDIFAEIEKGLNTYATTSRESINQYLSDFSDQLAQASRALSSSVEALTDIVEDVTDMNERLARRGGNR